MTPMEAYRKSLTELTHPRNTNQLQVHKWGIIAGLGKERIFNDLLGHWGNDRVPDQRELERAHEFAAAALDRPRTPSCLSRTVPPRFPPSVQARVTRKIYYEAAGEPIRFYELANLSPIGVGDLASDQQQRENAGLLLGTLFNPGEKVFCGEQHSTSDNVMPLESWVERIQNGQNPSQYMINPLTGQWEDTVDGKGKTRRGKRCVSDLRYTLFETDKIDGEDVPLPIQAGFLWRRITEGWPVRAIIFSGGKSLHAIVEVNQASLEKWEINVKQNLFKQWEKLGADKSTNNPDRLSRLPGHYRADKGNMQSLLWLCPQGWRYTEGHAARLRAANATPNFNAGENLPNLISAQVVCETVAAPVASSGKTPSQKEYDHEYI